MFQLTTEEAERSRSQIDLLVEALGGHEQHALPPKNEDALADLVDWHGDS
jgi:hypothetical protein